MDDIAVPCVSWESASVCFDCRPLIDGGAFDPETVYDLQLAFDCGSLVQAARRLNGLASLVRDHADVEQSLYAHRRAAGTVGIDLARFPLSRVVPRGQLERLSELRSGVMRALAEQFPEEVSASRGPARLMPALRAIELAGVAIDVPYADGRLTDRTLAPAARDFYRSAAGASRGGLAHTRYSPVGVRTGRIRVDGGLNTMGIPKGECRDAVVSRFPGGRVCSLDFNAIDYRCIVASVPEIAGLYVGCDDFHERTREACGLHGFTRDQVKFGTYVCMYGGSQETLGERTLLSPIRALSLRAGLESPLAPIIKFRQELHSRALRDGYVTTPSGNRVHVESDDHPGKVLGLYAQTFSSETFGRALVAAVGATEGMRSRVAFPVHDELVLDLHPAEPDALAVVREAVLGAAGLGFSVKCGTGATYREATE